jgi:glycosyltransferase involved in cell wall biosynthesis
MSKEVLFLSYWSLREPLNASAVFPYLRILSERPDVRRIHFITLETAKGKMPQVELDIPKVVHTALEPVSFLPHLAAKALLFLWSIPFLVGYIKRNKIDLMIAKASIAGALADLVSMWIRVPYNVESFEPHSQYMLECGVWRRNSIRFRFSRYMEERQIARARFVVTVTHNHRVDLISAGVSPERVYVIPSITDLDAFRFDPQAGCEIRTALDIPLTAKVGIYVGKFGGLYFDEEAFQIFARAIEHFGDMHIVVLSPSDHQELHRKAAEAGIPIARFHVATARHVDVPRFLSAADMAFSTIRPAPIKRYQCPIKNGEYWACGLPIIMTDEVSDDHLMMREGVGGSVFKADLSDLEQAFRTVELILTDPDHKDRMRSLATRFRSMDIARSVYQHII